MADTKALFARGFVTAAEVKKSELAVTQARNALSEAETALSVLTDYTYQSEMATRQNALKAVEMGPLVAMHDFIETQTRLSNSEDAAEGVRSFVERRAARFVGR